MDINEENNPFPLGIGYKSCWMVIEGSDQKSIAEAFLQDVGTEYSYKNGLKKVENQNVNENKILVTNTYNSRNYIIGLGISEFFYKTEDFLEKCKLFPRVYVYMTHHVSETHGFALVENGKLTRLFSYDDDEIKNIGNPLPEENTLGYNLPKCYDDVWNDEVDFTEVDEEIVIQLAICQIGIDEEKYPYNDVVVGNLFKYSTDSDHDSSLDYNDNLDIQNENETLQKVQEFKDNKNCSNEKCKLYQFIKKYLWRNKY